MVLRLCVLQMYDGEVFALLGHNGAGKTTLMSILTGLQSPDTGEVFVDGHDISSELDEIRQSLGICPQQDDLLFDQLTVRQVGRSASLLPMSRLTAPQASRVLFPPEGPQYREGHNRLRTHRLSRPRGQGQREG
jgi:ABC-type multidrug transport system ATPase subunit